ncbi:uncharacterized protein LOC107632954 [Arachis ipaensis]|uniref:uncharacterized protein LOC107632954 n=1 Tax=Arachis ipaensis TaxID=130454 RepID=UPI0007AF1461|nr:uncharacterized protein LOC107632954 [Arachis ipaensis]
MCVTHCDRRDSVFVVEELNPFESWSQGLFRVRLSAGTCDCGLFQSLHFLYRHALAACATTNIEWGIYIHPVYMQDAAAFKVYEVEFSPNTRREAMVRGVQNTVASNPAMRRKVTGRPVSTRFRNKMDEAECQEKQCFIGKSSILGELSQSTTEDT